MNSNPFNLSDKEMQNLCPEGITELINIHKWRIDHNRCTKHEKEELKEEIKELEKLLKIAKNEP